MKARGFALIELVIVLAIGAILLGIGIPTFEGLIDKNRLTVALSQVEADLRKAQAMSKAIGENIEVLFIPGNSEYYIFKHPPTSTPILLEKIQIPEGVRIYTNTAPANKIVYFGAYAESEVTGGTITFKSPRGKMGKVIVASITGRIRIEK
ncbi:MAG: prepilin-type N-terminal cleavage/methylation domain-containing protein [Caldiserica bacterium]|jgi:type IV fimbrial biogenesis protein FimT|nr:prepilin-type N-terminal cleavage/methylation domain-containing protein [Caldisericota bacterium]MDH7561821.1 prepilin-type N-terminal cleavage/methylation domain-containing protein [Caldisericota bacterium]